MFLFPFNRRYTLVDVFTPTKAATVTYVERDALDYELRRCLQIPGMQIVLFGHTGSGKTTLIMNELNRHRRKYLTTSCIEGTTVDTLIGAAFDQLGAFYSDIQTTKSSQRLSAELRSQYGLISGLLGAESTQENQTSRKRIIPVQLTPQRLTDFMGNAGLVWIIEDFHKVAQREKTKFSQILKVFVDAANRYPRFKVICIGAVGTAREVVQHEKELSTRVAEIKVPLLSPDELRQIVQKGGQCLNVAFDDALEDEIVHYSNNLAAVCHHLCYNVCYYNKIEQTQRNRAYLIKDQLQSSIESYVKQNTDTFAKILDNAMRQKKGRYENVRLILEALIELEEPVAQHQILEKIRRKAPDYPASNLTAYLKPLATIAQNEILRYDGNAKKYSFSNPFFKAFVMMVFSSEKKRKSRSIIQKQILISNFPEFYSLYINRLRSIMEEYNYMREKYEREMKKK